MKRRPRIYYTEEQKALMWDRWVFSWGRLMHGPGINPTKQSPVSLSVDPSCCKSANPLNHLIMAIKI